MQMQCMGKGWEAYHISYIIIVQISLLTGWWIERVWSMRAWCAAARIRVRYSRMLVLMREEVRILYGKEERKVVWYLAR